MNDAYFGNRFSIEQRRYLGAKTKLLSFIDNVLQQENVRFESFADLFGGTGTVTNHFRNRAETIVNDILQSNVCIYQAFWGDTKLRDNLLADKLAYYNTFESHNYPENYFSENFSGTYFDAENAKRIGIIRDDIEYAFANDRINSRERNYLITSLIYALDRIANTVGHYDAYRKVDIPAKHLTLLPLDIGQTPFQTQIFKEDANSLVRHIHSDVTYIDPPYNSRQYSDSYHLLENIASWKKEPVFGVAKKIDRSNLKSRYSMKSAGIAFRDLIEHLDTKYILISYNDMGDSGDERSRARISDREILSALEEKGEVKVFKKDFNQFTTGKSHRSDLHERIFYCKVSSKTAPSHSASPARRNHTERGFVKSPLNYTGGKYRLLPQLTQFFPDHINTFYDVFAGGANVGINVSAQKIVCIEKNPHVVDILNLMQKVNFEELDKQVMSIIDQYGLSQSYLNGYAYYGADSSHGLGRYNKDAFLRLRDHFNLEKSDVISLLTLIFYSFNNQVRFNKNDEFNLPVGKRDYNGNSRRNIASFNQAANEKNIIFQCTDYLSIEENTISRDDFVYLDPPYLLGRASYNEVGGWTELDEVNLYSMLTRLDKHGIRFALSNVLEHKGKINNILADWATDNHFIVNNINYNYSNSNYHSTAKQNTTREVLITNY